MSISSTQHILKISSFVFLFLLSCLNINSQTINWKTSADSSAVFEINNKEAEFLMVNKGNNDKIKELIHNLKKRPPLAIYTGLWQNKPSEGHFVHASVVENRVNYRYEMVMPFQVFLFKEYGILTLQVIDHEGKIRDDAKIKIKGGWSLFDRGIDFDKETQTYRVDDASDKEERIMTVELDKFKAVFELSKHIIHPQWGDRHFGDRDNDGPDFYSYMITDKNKYRPHETVRFKSYALSGKKKPLKEKIEVWLNTGKGYYDSNYKKIKTIEPYHPGGYADEVQLHDSLKLKLDYSYNIQLRTQKGKVIASGSFKYEDYELFYTRMVAKVQNSIQYFPDTNKVEIQIVDANGLIIPDMKADVLIRRRDVSKTFTDLLIMPDTLISKRISLDNDAPTIFNIPPTTMKEANCSYEVIINALTHDGQPLSFHDYVIFYREKYALVHSTHNDSLRIAFTELGHEKEVKAWLSLIGSKESTEVTLPYSMPFVQGVQGYGVYVPQEKYSDAIRYKDLNANLSLDGGFAADSFKVKLINPLQLDLTWYIYKGNMMINKGAGKEFDFSYPETDLTLAHYVEIFYTIGGEDRVFRQIFTPKTEYLAIDVNLPDRVYPGQKLSTTITVKDSWGSPVKDVDLTAFAVNSQLNYYLPDLPYYGSQPINREQRDSYGINKRDYLTYTEPLIRWTYWNKLLGLDKQDYYQFTYPWYKTFTYTINAPDSVTQFAPFVMYQGASVHPYVIEANGKPVYFSWTKQPQNYSFIVSDTLKYNISMRFPDRIVKLQNVQFEKGKKTILSIDITHLPNNASTQKINSVNYNKEDVFSLSEMAEYSKYISVFPVAPKQHFNTFHIKDSIYPIFHHYLQTPTGEVLTGPLPEGRAKYANGVEYKHENGFRYVFDENVVYKYPLGSTDMGPSSLVYFRTPALNYLNEFALTKTVFNELIRQKEKIERWYPTSIRINQVNMSLNFILPSHNLTYNPAADTTGVSNLLLRDCVSDKIYYPSVLEHRQHKYPVIPPGEYDAILLYNDGRYIERKNVPVTAYAYTELKMIDLPLNEATDTSMIWLQLRAKTPPVAGYRPPADYRPSYQEHQLHTVNSAGRIGAVSGVVMDDTGDPLIGVAVMIKGTSYGTISDLDGKFSLDVNNPSVTLAFAYIGFEQQDIRTAPGSYLSVTLKESAQYLDEVVVMAYGTTKKSMALGSMSTVSSADNGNMIAPSESMEENADEDSSKEGEKQLYAELLQLSSGLRSNFSDVGFWQPRLYTDRKGKASFDITFPDNITSWNTLVYAMNRKLKTGTWRKTIKSYKPLMAELAMPRFLVAGDSSYFASTIRNYTGDKQITGRIVFALGQDTLQNKTIEFANSYRDKLLVEATPADSLSATYLFIRNDGYQDGEKRTIPIEPQGTEIAEGFLSILRNGDKQTVLAKEGEEIDISISGRQLDVYMDATYYLTGYKYACNEQLASKLMGLLNYKLYQKFKEEEFKNDKQINEIIKRLVDNRTDRKLWSWWGNSPTQISFWMSAHIMKALRMARDAGYTVNLDMSYTFQDYNDVRDYRTVSFNDLRILHALSDWGAEQNYEGAINKLDSLVRKNEQYEDSVLQVRKKQERYYRKKSYLKEKLSLWDMRLKHNIGYVSDSIQHYLKKDALGAIYCTDGNESYYWYDNELSTTLLAYEIVRKDSSLMHLKESIQMYILSTKRNGWNTYQASSAVSAVLPDLLGENTTKDKQATVVLSGKDTGELSKFPYNLKLKAGERLYIEKKEGLPLFYSESILTRVSEERKGDAFEVTSVIGDGSNYLTEGKTTSMTVTVQVKQKNAEHILIEIPIPAGCSYASKDQARYWNREVHREYFKEKTVIFCESLPEGKYTFTVQLLPRYTGRYIVNPAKVEMMYFPVINANNDLKKVTIIE